MEKHLLKRTEPKRFMARSKIWGPEKGDLLISDGKEIVVDNCYLSATDSTEMMDYVVKGHHDEDYVKLRIPVEELNNNGWSWVREKFPFKIDYQVIPGDYHVVNPLNQVSVDVVAKTPSAATAKALSFFMNNPNVEHCEAPFLHVHRTFKITITPSALKMVSSLNRAIKKGKSCEGPLAECFNHPVKRKLLPDRSRMELKRLQKRIEEAFLDFYGSVQWASIGEATSYSTEDFQICEMTASLDGDIQVHD